MGLSICKCTSRSPIGNKLILSKFVCIYLDDIFVISCTKEKHYTHLDTQGFNV